MNFRLCPKCNGKVSNSRSTCIHCGYAFQTKICPDCGEEVDINAAKCPTCDYVFEGEQPAKNNSNDSGEVKKVTKKATENSEKCPYCGSNELMQIGIEYFICETCKNKFLKHSSTSGEYTFIPDPSTYTSSSSGQDSQSGSTSSNTKTSTSKRPEGKKTFVIASILSILAYVFLIVWWILPVDFLPDGLSFIESLRVRYFFPFAVSFVLSLIFFIIYFIISLKNSKKRVARIVFSSLAFATAAFCYFRFLSYSEGYGRVGFLSYPSQTRYTYGFAGAVIVITNSLQLLVSIVGLIKDNSVEPTYLNKKLAAFSWLSFLSLMLGYLTNIVLSGLLWGYFHAMYNEMRYGYYIGFIFSAIGIICSLIALIIIIVKLARQPKNYQYRALLASALYSFAMTLVFVAISFF